MNQQIEPAELSTAVPQQVQRIGQVLRDAGYCEDSMNSLSDGAAARELRPETVGLVWARTGDGAPLSTFARLFMLGVPVPREQLAAAVDPMGLEEWLGAGLVVSVGERLVATVRIEPFRGRLVASDPPSMLGHPDIVLGPANASRMLLNVTVRRSVSRALDLGCGSGVQALEAAAHADHVVAVDINPRAAMMTRFNAQLNGVESIEVRQGSLFEPVAEERFDLIVANPPFVISPDDSFRYRDGGMDGDGMVRFLAASAGAFLEEGGFFQMVCDWATVRGQPWTERLAGWFAGTGCDVQVLRSSHMPVEAYAALWIGQTESGGAAERIATLERWLEAYRQLEIESVSSGIVVARRRSAQRNWFRPGPAPPKMMGPSGEAIVRRFELRDRLQAVDSNAGFLGLRPRRADSVRLDQRLEPEDRGWALEEAHLHLIAGLAERQQIDPVTAALVARCDGTRTVRDLAVEAATAIGRPADELLNDLGPVLESMLELGFLELD